MTRLLTDRILAVAADLEGRAKRIHKKKWRGHLDHRSGVCDAYTTAVQKIRDAALSVCCGCGLDATGVSPAGEPFCNECAHELGEEFEVPND